MGGGFVFVFQGIPIWIIHCAGLLFQKMCGLVFFLKALFAFVCVWWHTPVIPILRRLGRDEFEASLGLLRELLSQ